MKTCDVAIIGAGPYGLSTAACLRSSGVSVRIFGEPMELWLKNMPRGMHLKSEGFASSLCDPGSTFTLKQYCEERGLPYADTGNPVPLEVFSAYGLEFQKRFVPHLERVRVVRLERAAEGFRLTLSSGEEALARKVVVAVGPVYYPYLPPELAGLPEEFVTHSSRHSSLEQFSGRDVAVVGAGASALDIAALLHEAGASVQVLARRSRILFHDPPDEREQSFWYRLRRPLTGIGPGWKLLFYVKLPLVFRLLPESFRIKKVRDVLGPAPCWFTRELVEGRVVLHTGVRIERAARQGNGLRLHLRDASGKASVMDCDHVIAATGFRPDVQRLPFLDPGLVASLRRVGDSPALSSNFESSVRGLYFVGIAAANTFGPLLRFAYGAGFAAPRLASHLARRVPGPISASRAAVSGEAAPGRESAEAVAR